MKRLLCCLALSLLTGASANADEPVDFNRDIRPLLSDRCFFCHGPDEKHREADLRLDDEAAAKGHAITPGDPDASELIARILSDHADLRMPPPESGKSLSVEEIELLRRWIAEGAKYAPYWAYAPPQRRDPPDVVDGDESLHWIDRFLQAAWEKADVRPAPPADRVTLLRRLSFDLTGLPPTPEEVAAFVQDDHPDAWERQIDRLLASDGYGERMAIFWLDLVRYADTVGYHGDQDHNISPYRDYVIQAFNDNVPFDRMTREQLAGDLLPESGVREKVASGYNRLLQTTHEGGLQQKEYLAIYAADRVRNVSAVWMGATVGCAQCHDHKYDPYTLHDFYALSAFFSDVDEARHFTEGTNTLPTRRPPEMPVYSEQERIAIEELEAQLQRLASSPTSTDSTRDPVAEERRRDLEDELKKLRDGARQTMITVAIEPRPVRVLPRGNWLDETGPLVQPAPPEFLGSIATNGARATRLDLANWLTDADQGVGGLTARVLSNRLWALMFGAGISRSLEDFGGQGEPPSQPELLDALAVELLDSGWDIKHLIKTIALSEAYQRSSVGSDEQLKRDPENRLYARQARSRLPAEMIRDNALAISGLLVREVGGASVKPQQPEGYYRHLNFPPRVYKPDNTVQQWRRGVYMHWQRQFLHPSLKAFDAPSREECTAERPQSNTPLAALVLLNDPNYVETARGFAARLLIEAPNDDQQRLNRAFALALSRAPDEFEHQLLLDLLQRNRNEFTGAPERAARLLKVGESPVGRDQNAVELASWMQVTRTLLNMNETITRN